MSHGSVDYYNPAANLAKLLRQAMGEAVVIHNSGVGVAGGVATKVLDAWSGRTGFSISHRDIGRVFVGGSEDCGMASLGNYGEYTNETYCGDVYVGGTPPDQSFAYEEW